MKRLIVLLLTIIAFYTQAKAQDSATDHAAIEKEITVVADIWCPYNCEVGTQNPGYIIEVANEIFGKKGIKVNYEIMPWERAIEETRKGTYNAIIGARYGDAPDFIFPEEAEGSSQNVFFVKNDSDWKYDGVDSLNGKSLGVIDGYSYSEEIDKYVKKNLENSAKVQSVAGETGLEQNFSKLLKGRIDAYIEDMNVGMKFIADKGMWGKYKIAGKDILKDPKENNIYLAFSPVNKDSIEYSKILSEGIKEMRQNGKLKEILTKYSISDWVEGHEEE